MRTITTFLGAVLTAATITVLPLDGSGVTATPPTAPCRNQPGQAVAKAPAGTSFAPARIAQVSWISGDWIILTGSGSIEERWSDGDGGAMLGTSRTLRGGLMTEFEFLCISERDGTLVYTAMPNANTPTDFTLTHVDADSATFENPDHDFPKMIRYSKRADGGLDASISAGGTSRPRTFSFKRKE